MKDNKLVIVIDYDNGIDEEGIKSLKSLISDWGNQDLWFDSVDFWCNQELEEENEKFCRNN